MDEPGAQQRAAARRPAPAATRPRPAASVATSSQLGAEQAVGVAEAGRGGEPDGVDHAVDLGRGCSRRLVGEARRGGPGRSRRARAPPAGSGSRLADRSVSDRARPNEVSTTVAPCSWAMRAHVKAMEAGVRTPVISTVLPSSSMVLLVGSEGRWRRSEGAVVVGARAGCAGAWSARRRTPATRWPAGVGRVDDRRRRGRARRRSRARGTAPRRPTPAPAGSSSGSSASASSRRFKMATAPAAPITAIWAVGQASTRSLPIVRESMTM